MSQTGKDTQAYCTKCKMDLNHVIVAMQGDRVAKVQCHTCHGTHQFRAPKGAKTPQKAKAKSASSQAQKKIKAIEDEFQEWKSARGDQEKKSYQASQKFEEGQRLEHPKFGEGFVRKHIHPNKIEVLFSDDVKTLVHKP